MQSYIRFWLLSAIAPFLLKRSNELIIELSIGQLSLLPDKHYLKRGLGKAVFVNPSIQIGLQFVKNIIDLFTKCNPVKFIQYGLVEPIATNDSTLCQPSCLGLIPVSMSAMLRLRCVCFARIVGLAVFVPGCRMTS